MITVRDTTPPAVTTAQGANATIECPAVPSFTAPVFTDLCAGVITPSVVTVTNTVGCSNIVTRTWTATDPCGNTTNRSQVVTVVDTTPPAVTTAQGANATIECPATPSFTAPVFMDLCAGVITPSVATVTNTSGCTNIITRTWTATDSCGNTTNRSQVITVNCCTNSGTICCTNCTPNNFVSYTNTVVPGYNFLANNLCPGTNNTVNDILTNVPSGSTELYIWNYSAQSYNSALTYYTAADANNIFGSNSGDGWYDSNGNRSSTTLALGDGFILRNVSGAAFTLVIRGCPPICPPPCLPPTNGLVLVGRYGIGTATWSDLSSCPPVCGTEVLIWSASGFTAYDYVNGAWTPPLPVLAVGQSVFVHWLANTNCCTNNLVVNGGFEAPLVSSGPFFANGSVPGWNGYVGSCGGGSAFIELWGTGTSIQPAEGSQDLEISSSIPNEAVCQILTNLTPGCLATICFQYTGRPGIDSTTGLPYDNNFTFGLSGGNVMSVPLNPPAYNTNVGWQQFCTNFVPGSSTVTISFSRNPTNSNDVGGAHIDNVSLTQCCPTNPCITLTCAGDKTVPCGTNWVFDAPTNIIDTCCTNYSVTFNTVTNSFFCPWVFTRTWLVSDACGHSNTCSQKVTVVDTTPPALTCSSNKTVLCGAAWNFDTPVTSDICSGTNVTLTFTTVTNGVCPQVITRTWTATDLCGNTNTCSQTVTVVACVPAPSGMTLWLPFDEASGTTSANLYAGGNNGTQINAPSVNLGGYVANSLCFNGANQSVSVPDYPAINPGTGDLSVDAWVKRDPASGNTVRIIVDKRNPTTTVGYSLSVSFGNLLFQLCDSPGNFTNYRDTGVLPADNQWHFIAVTVSRNLTNGGRFYIDGNPTATFDPTGHPGSLNNTNAFLVATTPLGGATPWLGCIDEVEFFLRVLAPSEVQGIFNAGPAGKCKSPELVCATNKVVQCGTAWSFDPPVAATPCSGTNSLVVIGTVTNGVCPTVVTRTWQLVDACGHTNTCSQTVSIVDTTPPVITCPSNIVVTTCTNAGVVVNYTVTATDACCTNVTIGGTPRSGSVFQPGSTTVSCTATDCCGNVSTCGFTVTVNVVNDTTPPVFTTYCTTNHIVFGGNNFATPVAATPSANLLARLNAAGIHNFKNFDECTVNTYFAHTFSGLPPCITSATLTMRLKPCGDICENDAINLSFTGPGGVLSSNYWTRYLGSGNPQTGLLNNDWCGYTGGQVITLDLAALPQPSAPPLNDIPLLNANGFLDLNMQDDTGIDYAILDVVSCCCATNKTIPYGTPWSFDQPSAYDAVWGTNVTITSITQTSSLCPLVITRTWIATDPCGNNSTCSQTITVGQAGPCQIFNTGMAGTNGNIPVAIGSPDPNFVLVSSPGAGTSCVVEGNLAGAWLPNSSTSEWVGPAIDTSSSPAGLYHYQLVFILCCTNNAQMNGRMAVDDSAGLYLNGNSVGAVIGYASYTPVNISSGFVPGVNVLDIYVTNAVIFTGLRAELTNCAGGMVVACSTNKVVDCGSPWNFDPPVASSCCSSNLSIVVTAAATNGNCPKVASRTWRITDGCGNTNFCTQTVTVRDITAPVVACPNTTIIVALDANCKVHIPLIRPAAKDNCTPASQLVYTQNPPAGSTLPGPCQPVTVTVRDACGNLTLCHVLVCGQDKTPPIVSYPKVITVTNCLVPNVLPFLIATDNCTPPNLLHFTQSPLPGTPIAAGGNVVTVTVTDQAGNTTTIVITLVNSGPNSFLNVMFNTGVDSSKVVVPGGSVDPHYTLGPVPGGTPTGGANYNAPNAIVMASFWGLPPYTTSRWIDPEVNAWSSNPTGFYTYTNQFVLPVGANPLTASISGRWAADDGAAMYFNGVLQPGNGIPVLPYPNEQSGFNHWHPFTISSGFAPNPNKNTILFVVTNAAAYSPGPTGLRVEYTNAVVNCSTCTPPTFVWLTPSQSRPLNSTAVFSATVSGTPPLTYQWYHNNVPLSNNGHYTGVNTATLTIIPVGYADAGIYYVCVANPCGGLCSLQRKLNVTKGWWQWPWAWWDFSQVGNPLAATVGPDLILTGTNTLGISSGSTADFGLPNIGGQSANVINVPPLPGDTYIQLPFVALPDSYSVSSYTLVMDVYEPTNSTGTNTLFEIIGSSGQDGFRWLEATDTLIVSGNVGGVPVILTAGANPGRWNRVALVMDQPDDNASGEATLTLYVNGEFANSLVIHGTPHVPVLPIDYLADTPPTLLSSPEGTSGELYASSIQFHAIAMTAEMIAGLGSPDNGPIPANDTSVGVQPVLSASSANGLVNLSWTGSTFVLQEATDLTSGLWVDSGLPFDESEVSGDIVTTAHANPATEGPVKFYRLIYKP